MKFDLFYSERCPYCRKVIDAILHSKVKSNVQLIDIDLHPDAFEKFVEKTKAKRRTVPVLRIKGKIHLYESDDIIDFLSMLKYE